MPPRALPPNYFSGGLSNYIKKAVRTSRVCLAVSMGTKIVSKACDVNFSSAVRLVFVPLLRDIVYWHEIGGSLSSPGYVFKYASTLFLKSLLVYIDETIGMVSHVFLACG